MGQHGHDPGAQRLVRNAGNFFDVSAFKEIFNLCGESLGRVTVHLRRINVTKVCEQINLQCAQTLCEILSQIVK